MIRNFFTYFSLVIKIRMFYINFCFIGNDDLKYHTSISFH